MATEVTAGNVADGAAAENLLAEVLEPNTSSGCGNADVDADVDPDADADADADVNVDVDPDADVDVDPDADKSKPVEIYGDSSYGTGELVDHIEGAGAEANVKVQPPSGAKGKFRKDDF